MILKKILLMVLVLLCFMVSGCSKSTTSGKLDNISFKETSEETNYVKIEMKDGKMMILELYPDIAPITVENFKSLVKEEFYDGLTFHRIAEGFMIQGGDPTGTGRGGSSKTISGEFILNGFTNTLMHTKGVISMARGEDYDSASSQFFICLDSASHLNGSYAAFGKVIAGFDTLEALGKTKVNGETPINKPVMKSIRFVTI